MSLAQLPVAYGTQHYWASVSVYSRYTNTQLLADTPCLMELVFPLLGESIEDTLCMAILFRC